MKTMKTATANPPADTGPQTWHLLPTQAAFVESTEPFLKLVGPRGSGKTYAGAAKAILYALGNPGSLGLAAARDYQQLIHGLIPIFTDLLDPAEIANWDATGTLLLRNQSLIRFDYHEGLWERNCGRNYAWVWLDDADFSAEADLSRMKVRLRQQGYPHQMWWTECPVPVFMLYG